MGSTTTQGTGCSICNDTGWVIEGGVAKRCTCFEALLKKARVSDLVCESGLRGALLNKTFDNFIPKTKSQRAALEKVKGSGNFFLIGPWGIGKTHLLAASVNDALKKGVCAVFFSVPWLLKVIREDLLSNRPVGILEKVCEVEYLALDDLGKEKPSETVQEKLFMIFDRREIDGLRTCVTSNYIPETLVSEKLDGAIIDRIVGMCDVILLEGESYRRER
jgi:DNA replication protein DnaC